MRGGGTAMPSPGPLRSAPSSKPSEAALKKIKNKKHKTQQKKTTKNKLLKPSCGAGRKGRKELSSNKKGAENKGAGPARLGVNSTFAAGRRLRAHPRRLPPALGTLPPPGPPPHIAATTTTAATPPPPPSRARGRPSQETSQLSPTRPPPAPPPRPLLSTRPAPGAPQRQGARIPPPPTRLQGRVQGDGESIPGGDTELYSPQCVCVCGGGLSPMFPPPPQAGLAADLLRDLG